MRNGDKPAIPNSMKSNEQEATAKWTVETFEIENIKNVISFSNGETYELVSSSNKEFLAFLVKTVREVATLANAYKQT